jgi:hypothetical protein
MKPLESRFRLLRRLRIPLALVLMLHLAFVTKSWYARQVDNFQRVAVGQVPEVNSSSLPPPQPSAPASYAVDCPESSNLVVPGVGKPQADTQPDSQSEDKANESDQVALTPSQCVDHSDEGQRPTRMSPEDRARMRQLAADLHAYYLKASKWEWPRREAVRFADWMHGVTLSFRRNQAGSDSPHERPDQPYLVLRNPLAIGGVVHYQVDEAFFSLQPGTEHRLDGANPRHVGFHRGGDFGEARLVLTTGHYVFTIGDHGWDLQPADTKDP